MDIRKKRDASQQNTTQVEPAAAPTKSVKTTAAAQPKAKGKAQREAAAGSAAASGESAPKKMKKSVRVFDFRSFVLTMVSLHVLVLGMSYVYYVLGVDMYTMSRVLIVVM